MKIDLFKKVYLDNTYKLDCEQKINYMEYIRNNKTSKVVLDNETPCISEDNKILYQYKFICHGKFKKIADSSNQTNTGSSTT